MSLAIVILGCANGRRASSESLARSNLYEAIAENGPLFKELGFSANGPGQKELEDAMLGFALANKQYAPNDFVILAQLLTGDVFYRLEAENHAVVMPNAYGPGVHMNRYGAPIIIRPDWGGVPGEVLKLKLDAYGPGVHMDQYGRPAREYSWP
jgi:hypothetical protein